MLCLTLFNGILRPPHQPPNWITPTLAATCLGFVEGGAFHVPLVSDRLITHQKTESCKELSSKTPTEAIAHANGRGLFASTFLRATAHNALERSVRELRNTKKAIEIIRSIGFILHLRICSCRRVDENVMKAHLSKAARDIGLSDDVFEDKARANSELRPVR